MSKKKEVVRSKYFTIDSYFRSSKAIQSVSQTSCQQDSVTIEQQRREPCPVCNTMIYTESVSMEVHINQCLDAQETISDTYASLDTSFTSSLTTEATFTSSLDAQEYALEQQDTTMEECITKAKQENGAKDESDNSNYSKEGSVTTDDQDRRILPSAWKSLFSLKQSSDNNKRDILAPKNTNNFKVKIQERPNNTKTKPCPFYKRVKDTRFVVDAFNYGKIPDCDGYFLTHFHSDHYGGLRSRWSHGPIYCSKITANLVRQELRVDSRFVHPLPMNEPYPIPGSNVTVALIDANHCPGSVLFLFIIERPNKTVVRHLHTGDFRAAPRMCLHPLLRQPDNPPIQCLYLDTTYLNPQYAFPAQEECIQAVCDTVQKEIIEQDKKKENTLSKWFKSKTEINKRVLIVVGTYTVGKERVFINVAKMLKCKIYANEKKAKILHCLEDEELRSMLTKDPKEAQVHVVSLRDIRADIMANYLWDLRTHFDSLIAFKPTGWAYKSTANETVDMNFAALSQVIMPPSNRTLKLSPNYESTNIKIYAVPYSEHSSFRELASFIASLDIQQIIPTVNISQKDKLFYFIDKWQQEKVTKPIEVVAYPNEDYW